MAAEYSSVIIWEERLRELAKSVAESSFAVQTALY